MEQKKQSRRVFIKTTAIGATGLLVANKLAALNSLSSNNKSKVIIAHSDLVMDEAGKVDPEILQQLLDDSILKLSGEKSLKKAWRKYFTPEDIIGMKVNGNSYSYLKNTPMVDHFPLITQSILNSFEKAGLAEENSIIWERSDLELADMGYKIQKEPGSLRVMGTTIERRPGDKDKDDPLTPGFSTVTHPVGEKSTNLTAILEDECTALINLPALKSHRLAGVTGALKNHYGTIINPRDFHDDDCCNPGIAEINNIPTIKEKHKLVICNALLGLWDGGPRWNTESMWNEGSLIIGEDPVAVDSVMLEIIDEKRKEAGLPPVKDMAKHLLLSEETGLGNSKFENIDIEHLTI